MKKLAYLILTVFISSNTVLAQSELNKYSYVLVPQQFEFQNNKDQFNLNSLTRHLFKGAGFNALYQEELRNLSRCDGLYADVISTTNVFFTRLTVVLRNCNNEELFRSDTGMSKEKDYRKGYHEALRNAFKSIEILGVKQIEINSPEVISLAKNKTLPNEKNLVFKEPRQITSENSLNAVTTKYSYNGKQYYLENLSGNLILYKATNTGNTLEKIGTLSKTSRNNMYVFNSNEINTLATFDANNNLIIDVVDTSGNVLQEVYKIEN
ncbi:MAG: hypothetical protein H0X63_07755 [Flavobacteriales bacterium]|jgi:hypothetical protein|nr:hypothetical protein [Flavobacteriales bacterium]